MEEGIVVNSTKNKPGLFSEILFKNINMKNINFFVTTE